jgi:hypothetical protein
MTRITPQAGRLAPAEPTPACERPPPTPAGGPVVGRYDAGRARVERALAVVSTRLGEEATRAVLRALDPGDALDVQLRGHLRAVVAAGFDGRARVQHEGDHTFTVELGARGTLGAAEPASGARALGGGEGSLRLRFQSAEGAADFLQAVATSGVPLLGSPGRVAVDVHRHLEAARLWGVVELGVGSHGHGLGRELAALGRLGLELEGGLGALVDLAQGALILEGRVEGAAVAQVNAPWAQLAALGAQVRGEARVQHRIPLPPATLEALLTGRCGVGALIGAGETVLTFESEVDASAVATLGGAGASLRAELHVPLGRLAALTPEALGAAVHAAELRVRAFTSRETDVGGAGLDAQVAGVSAGWRARRLALDARTTLGAVAEVLERWRRGPTDDPRPVSAVDARAAAARLRR